MANVIITGASRGIGYQLVQLFAQKGHNVLALSRNTRPIKDLQNERISLLPFDITKEEDLLQLNYFLEDHWNAVDILINNAGRLLKKPFAETTKNDFQKVYEVNFFGVAEIIKLVLPRMNTNSHVVTISSMGGVQGSLKFPGLAAYSSSKAAAIALTELLAEEYKDNGPSFNVLALGAVQTEMLEEAFPGYQAPVSAIAMANYIMDFALTGHKFYNGKLLQVSSSTP